MLERSGACSTTQQGTGPAAIQQHTNLQATDPSMLAATPAARQMREQMASCRCVLAGGAVPWALGLTSTAHSSTAGCRSLQCPAFWWHLLITKHQAVMITVHALVQLLQAAQGGGVDDPNAPYSTSDLTRPEYSTDWFRMYCFKVRQRRVERRRRTGSRSRGGGVPHNTSTTSSSPGVGGAFGHRTARQEGSKGEAGKSPQVVRQVMRVFGPASLVE